MAQIGASQGIVAQSLTATVDAQGNQIVSADNAFGASPAGQALLTQQLFGLANATFNLTPPDVYSPIAAGNELPYWSFAEYSDNSMSGSAIYDSTAQTWGVILNPGTATTGDYCTLTTRSYLVNDDTLGLKQKALAIISKSGTAAGTTEWNLTLSATYYDATNTALSTAFIGTALDTGTWTTLAGTTTSGGSAISSAARYVDLQFKMTATATVTGSAKVTIKSLLLQSSNAIGSFLSTVTFTSSGTWTVPSGVSTLVAVAVVGAGGGGAGGCLAATGTVANPRISGGSGGAGGAAYSLAQNVSLGTATSVVIGIGAGGAGGAGATFTKAAAATTTSAGTGTNGAAGGATTVAFGGTTYITNGGGGGGNAGQSSILAAGCARGAVSLAGTYTNTIFGIQTASMGADFGNGAVGGSASTVATFSEAGGNGKRGVESLLYPFVTSPLPVAGNGATSSGTATTFTVGATGAAVGSAAPSGGGGGASSAAGSTAVSAAGSTGGDTGTKTGGAGAAGATIVAYITGAGAGTVVSVAGAGGTATANGGGGGGAGGGVIVTASTTANYNARAIAGTAGNGGAGSDGYVAIVYVG